MERLAILLPAMRMGGAEKIAINFIKELTNHFEVTVILNKKEGALLDFLPKDITVVEDPLYSFQNIVRKDLKRANLFRLFQDLIYYIKVKAGIKKEKNYRYLISRTPKREEIYDIAISYVANVSTQIFCLGDRIQAKKKVAWIHGETTELKDINLYNTYYKKFDKIFAVSEATKRHFLQKFPECAPITDVYYNPINIEYILERAKQPMDIVFDKNVVNIVSVGRVTPEKGFDMIPRIVKLLKEKGYPFHWYLIGDGATLPIVTEQTMQLGLKNEISLLGAKDNPYPYMKACDIYIQPSYEEGYSTTICEAGILGRAIIGTTTSGGIREQIREGISGLLAEPTVESIAKKIEELILDSDKRVFLGENISLVDFSHEAEMDKLFFVES